MQAWNAFINKLNKQMSESVINKWIRSLKIKQFDARNIYLEATDPFHAQWIKEHVLPIAIKELKNNNGYTIKIHLSIKNEKIPSPQKIKKTQKPIFISEQPEDFYSFTTFFADEQNELVVKLLKQITGYEEKISDDSFLTSFNPIFIYGPIGSGKTHLLATTAKELSKQGKNVFFTSAKNFTEHVVQAFRLGLLHDFRNAYRNAEVLIIDDIDLLAGKAATQEEFFHTFNTLHNLNRQIIISSTFSPGNLKNIEQRLISRFEWGITLPLSKVKQTTLGFILDAKEKHFSLNLTEETKKFLIESFPSTDKLQTAVQALVLRSSEIFKKSDSPLPIDIHHAKQWLSDLMEKQNELTPVSIIKAVANYFDISSNDILGKAQTKQYVLPRQTAMYFCREKLNIPYKKIGEIFNRDHSTVMAGIKHITQEKNNKLSEKKILSSLLEIEKTLNDY